FRHREMIILQNDANAEAIGGIDDSAEGGRDQEQHDNGIGVRRAGYRSRGVEKGTGSLAGWRPDAQRLVGQRAEQRNRRQSMNDQQRRDHRASRSRVVVRAFGGEASILFGRRQASFTPPILHTSFHSCAVTGCTERREYLTNAISLSCGVALTVASDTGF